eukprot:5105452-Amphidinium_carterae.1
MGTGIVELVHNNLNSRVEPAPGTAPVICPEGCRPELGHILCSVGMICRRTTSVKIQLSELS